MFPICAQSRLNLPPLHQKCGRSQSGSEWNVAVVTEGGRSPTVVTTATPTSFWKRTPLTEAVNAARIEDLHANEEPRSCRAHTSPTAK